jgi:predicted membrane channel-forming protein YqfA (hemolysin III family)
MPINPIKALRIAGLPVLIASLCCLTPVILVAFGLSSVAFAASLTNVLDGRFRWLFLLAGGLALAISLIAYLRRQNVCTLDQALKRRNEVINIVSFGVAAAVIGYIIFFYGIVDIVGRLQGIWR